jgi:hypothetical protein
MTPLVLSIWFMFVFCLGFLSLLSTVDLCLVSVLQDY